MNNPFFLNYSDRVFIVSAARRTPMILCCTHDKKKDIGLLLILAF
jgi:hypothetical protein